MTQSPLADRVIAIAESRELDVFAALLERRGARVLRYPLISIADAPDPAPVLDWLRQFSAGGCDDLILLTGEGLRRLLACCEKHEPPLRESFVAALARTRCITRGPKPARVLRQLGLSPHVEATVPTTSGVIEALTTFDLRGRRVGVQLYGSEPNLPLMKFISEAGAQVFPVAPYVYGDAVADGAVRELLQLMADGAVDAMAFTSKAQVERLFKVGPEELVRVALSRAQVAAIGPVVADALRSHGVAVAVMPEASWFMKPLTSELIGLLGESA